MAIHAGQVAITGAGVVNPVAIGLPAFQAALRHAKPALSKLVGVPVPRGKATVSLVDRVEYAGPDRALRMAGAAATQALTANGMSVEARTRTALILATMAGDSRAAEERFGQLQQLVREDRLPADLAMRASLDEAVRCYPNGTLVHKLCQRLGVHGPRFVISNACASGNIAIGLALDMVRSGRCDHVLVVGVEAVKLSMLWGAERAGFIGTALRPFHPDRDGAILGEGAAAIVLSRADEVATAPLGWVTGFGSVCDRGAAAITLAADGSGLQRAMLLALDDGGRVPGEVEYVSAHAPGTPMIDAIESAAVARLFGANLPAVALNATKSITAHLSGASAVTEAIAALLQMRGGFVHGNASLARADPALAFPPVGADTIDRAFSFSLSNACGGGGLNTSVALSSTRPALTGEGGARIPPQPLVITGSASVQDKRYSWLARDTCRADAPEGLLADFDVCQDYPIEANYHYMNRAAQLGASAGARALRSAGIAPAALPCADDRFAVIFGTCVGGAPQASRVLCERLVTNPNTLTPSMSLDHGIHLGAALVCRHFGLTGTTYTVTGSRRSGLQALEIAVLSVQNGRADAALVAGYDAFDPFENAVLNALELAGEIADGAAAVVLERADGARRREQRPQATLVDIRTLAGASDDERRNSVLTLQLRDYLLTYACEVIYLATPQPERYLAMLDQVIEMVPGNPTCLQLAPGLPDQRAGVGMSALVDAIASGRRAAVVAPGTNGVIHVLVVEPAP